ncbi:hypothetical protein [Halomonas halmophila]|nr:hypothetical protein [Halomonas halmophila]
MKLQMTLIAAFVAMAMSGSALADATQDHSGGNTNPHDSFQDSRDTIDGMAGYSGNSSNASESFILQGGVSNDADVTQYGEQFSDIDQDGYSNYSKVVQDDEVGSTSGQGQNESRIKQEGSDNYADVYQLGDRNDSYVEQDGLWGGGDDNSATVVQDGDLNDSYIKQFGDNNWADVYQGGDELDSDILQTGYGNDAQVVQTGYGHDSYIKQFGSGNWASHTQSGQSQHFAETRSYGHNNTANVVQAP